MNILIVGGSGGVGFGLVRKYIEIYPTANIVATYLYNLPKLKDPRLSWVRLDVTNEVQIETLADRFEFLDILINAVGMLHTEDHTPEKTVGDFDCEFFQSNIALNTVPSILLAKHFMSLLRSEKKTYYVVVSARIGSISDNKVGGWVSYRASKAALNMAMKTVSLEWKHKLPNSCILLFHPGTTDTALSKPFQKKLPRDQIHSAEFTAARLITLIENSDMADSGRFMSFDGSEISW